MGPVASTVCLWVRFSPVRNLQLQTSLSHRQHGLDGGTTPADGELYQRQIESTDAEIDALVYELYGLTEEEITIVEWRDH